MPDIGTGNLNLRELKKHLDNMSKVNSGGFFLVYKNDVTVRLLGKTLEGPIYTVWQYRLWSFQGMDTKLKRFFSKNQLKSNAIIEF